MFSPAVAVRRIDVASELAEEADDFVVARTDGVVEGGDSLVVGGAHVSHLPQKRTALTRTAKHNNSISAFSKTNQN